MNDKLHPGAKPPHPPGKEVLSTRELCTLLELLGRARRQQTAEQPSTDAATVAAALTESQLHQWFQRERYVIGDTLGSGGMASIHCAADLHLCRTVALKTALPEATPRDVSRFLYEAQITAQLQHPNIIPIYDCALDPHTDRPFFTMKYVEGQTVLSLIVDLRRKDPVARRQFGLLTERIQIFLKACDAIAYAHAHHVYHRDIKPANILVGEHGEVYVIDWGIALAKHHLPAPDPHTGRLLFPAGHIATFHDVYHRGEPTPEATFLGSPVHMAPEQFAHEDENPAQADIYSLGCTLYEMITLHAPFDPHLPLSRLLALKEKGAYLPVWRHLPSIPLELAVIIHKCMAPHRSRRFRSVHQLQVVLKRFVHGSMTARRKLMALRDEGERLDDTGTGGPIARRPGLKRLDAILKNTAKATDA